MRTGTSPRVDGVVKKTCATGKQETTVGSGGATTDPPGIHADDLHAGLGEQTAGQKTWGAETDHDHVGDQITRTAGTSRRWRGEFSPMRDRSGPET